jgi:glutathione-regulated potassium-efflux system ancillary protein KefC
MDLLTPALIYLALSVFLVPLFHKLGLGSVLGYLAAGILMGPHILSVVQNVESVASFAEFGVVFLLFVIGLELQPKKLWSMRTDLLGFGGLQIVLCTLGLGLAVRLFDFTWVQSFVIGFALSLSSTAFVIQTLIERKNLNTEFGQTSFAILLAQDIVAIPALALIPLLGMGATTSPLSRWTIVWFVATVAILFILSRYAIRPLLRFIASIKNREMFTATTLTIVLGVSVWMHHLGLSMGLGAFLAGVLLADSEYRHELEVDLEPFKGILMGLFFVSVGMAVNLNLLRDNPLLILALTLGYQVIKAVLIFAVGSILRAKDVCSKDMSIYLAQGGEFAFVLLALCLKANLLLSPNVEMITLVVTVSMILSPLIINLNEALTNYFINKKTPEKVFDEIDGNSNHVIIAGYGRFGQICGRILRSLNLPFTALELDPVQIDLLRKFGTKVYYGDASRIDLLEKAGISEAKLLVLAVDNMESSVATVQAVRERYPKLKILARARNRQHAFELRDLNVQFIKRETFDSAVELSNEMLFELGFSRERADLITKKFRLHDESMLIEQHLIRHDESLYVSHSRAGAEQLTQVLKDDINLN